MDFIYNQIKFREWWAEHTTVEWVSMTAGQAESKELFSYTLCNWSCPLAKPSLQEQASGKGAPPSPSRWEEEAQEKVPGAEPQPYLLPGYEMPRLL